MWTSTGNRLNWIKIICGQWNYSNRCLLTGIRLNQVEVSGMLCCQFIWLLKKSFLEKLGISFNWVAPYSLYDFPTHFFILDFFSPFHDFFYSSPSFSFTFSSTLFSFFFLLSSLLFSFVVLLVFLYFALFFSFLCFPLIYRTLFSFSLSLFLSLFSVQLTPSFLPVLLCHTFFYSFTSLLFKTSSLPLFASLFFPHHLPSPHLSYFLALSFLSAPPFSHPPLFCSHSLQSCFLSFHFLLTPFHLSFS